MIKRFDLYLKTAELGVMHIAAVAQQVREAIEQWPEYPEQAGASEDQIQRVGQVFQV